MLYDISVFYYVLNLTYMLRLLFPVIAAWKMPLFKPLQGFFKFLYVETNTLTGVSDKLTILSHTNNIFRTKD